MTLGTSVLTDADPDDPQSPGKAEQEEVPEEAPEPILIPHAAIADEHQ